MILSVTSVSWHNYIDLLIYFSRQKACLRALRHTHVTPIKIGLAHPRTFQRENRLPISINCLSAFKWRNLRNGFLPYLVSQFPYLEHILMNIHFIVVTPSHVISCQVYRVPVVRATSLIIFQLLFTRSTDAVVSRGDFAARNESPRRRLLPKSHFLYFVENFSRQHAIFIE